MTKITKLPNLLKIFSILFCILLLFSNGNADIYNMQLNHTCLEDSYDIFESPKITQYCTQYDSISCCDSESSINFFRTIEEDYSEDVTVQNDLTIWMNSNCTGNSFYNTCSYAKRGFMCFFICASDQIKEYYNWTTYFRVCESFGNWVYKNCIDEEVGPNCIPARQLYGNASVYFQNVFNMTLVPDSEGRCFSAGHSKFSSNWILLISCIVSIYFLLF